MLPKPTYSARFRIRLVTFAALMIALGFVLSRRESRSDSESLARHLIEWRDYTAFAGGPRPSVGLYWYDDADPTTGVGMAAPLDQLLVRTDTPSIYYKSGTANTAWTKIGAGAGGGGGLTGSGSAGLVARWTGSAALGNSSISDTGSGSATVNGTLVVSPGAHALASGGAMQIIAESGANHALDLTNAAVSHTYGFYFNSGTLTLRDITNAFDYMSWDAGTGYSRTAQGFLAFGPAPVIIAGSGQLIFEGNAVTLACNGTGSTACVSSTCNDNAGTFLTDTSATSCTVGFYNSTGNAPSCIVGVQDAIIIGHVTSETATTLTIGLSAGATAKNVDYVCGFH